MKINIKGAIVPDSDKWIYDLFDIECTSPNDVNAKLDSATNTDVEVIVNSGGGDVFSGSEIYTSLKDHKGKTTVKVVGVAASAASVVAMAGDRTLISPTAQMMIHNVQSGSRGDYRDHKHASDFLKNYNKSIANAYILKSGMSEDDLLKMMDKETWLNAQQAKENSFADEIMFDNPAQSQLTATSSNSQTLPPEVINKVRNEAMQQQQPQNNPRKDDENMDLEKLKNEYPDLYKQIKKEGYDEGTKVENERIKSIEDMAVSGHDDLINKAKYETKETAENVAMNIIKEQKQQGDNYLKNRNTDAGDLSNVEGASAPDNNNNDENKRSKQATTIANMINKSRGGNA